MAVEQVAGVLFYKYSPFALDLAKLLLGISLYSMFVYKFYRFLGQRDIFRHPDGVFSGRFAGFWNFLAETAYVFKYLVFTPFFVFFWSVVITALLVFMSKNESVSSILTTSLALVGAIRLTAYYSEDLSKDLAKLLPFVVLGVFLVEPGFFSLDESLQRVYEIPQYQDQLVAYFAFTVVIELVLRLFHGILSAVFPGSAKHHQ